MSKIRVSGTNGIIVNLTKKSIFNYTFDGFIVEMLPAKDLSGIPEGLKVYVVIDEDSIDFEENDNLVKCRIESNCKGRGNLTLTYVVTIKPDDFDRCYRIYPLTVMDYKKLPEKFYKIRD